MNPAQNTLRWWVWGTAVWTQPTLVVQWQQMKQCKDQYCIISVACLVKTQCWILIWCYYHRQKLQELVFPAPEEQLRLGPGQVGVPGRLCILYARRHKMKPWFFKPALTSSTNREMIVPERNCVIEILTSGENNKLFFVFFSPVEVGKAEKWLEMSEEEAKVMLWQSGYPVSCFKGLKLSWLKQDYVKT